ADVTMLALGDVTYADSIDKTYGFMDKFWDRSSALGGYAPRAALDGSNLEASTKFVDDNSLTGVTWLDAHEAVPDPSKKNTFLVSARDVANFLMYQGVWDTTYGGGFWWSTDKPDKPTQSNGLALQLFLRLAAITGETYYRDWAGSILAWLE